MEGKQPPRGKINVSAKAPPPRKRKDAPKRDPSYKKSVFACMPGGQAIHAKFLEEPNPGGKRHMVDLFLEEGQDRYIRAQFLHQALASGVYGASSMDGSDWKGIANERVAQLDGMDGSVLGNYAHNYIEPVVRRFLAAPACRFLDPSVANPPIDPGADLVIDNHDEFSRELFKLLDRYMPVPNEGKMDCTSFKNPGR